jgi:hypothetical protein
MDRNRNPRRQVVYLAITIAWCLLASACGSDGETDASGADETLAAQPSDTEVDDKPAPEPEPSGNNEDKSAFCAAADEVDNSLDSLAEGEIPTPEDLEAQFNELQTAMTDAVRLAPDDIRPDVEKSAEAFGIMVDAFEEAEYSFFDVDLGALDVVDSDPAFEEANEAMTQYLFSDCGIGTDPSLDADNDGDDTSDEPELEGTLREQIADEFVELGLTAEEADCIADNMDPATFSFDDTGGILALFEACDISLERLAELGG